MVAGVWNRAALVRVGLFAGAAQVVAGIAMYLAGVYFAPWSIFVSIVVLLACIVAGTRWYEEHFSADGLTYAEALLAGFAIGVATGLVYAVYNLVSISFVYPHFLDDLVRAQIAAADSRQRAHDSFEAMRAHVTAAGIAVPNLIRLSVVGLVLSLVTSVFLRKRS